MEQPISLSCSTREASQAVSQPCLGKNPEHCRLLPFQMAKRRSWNRCSMRVRNASPIIAVNEMRDTQCWHVSPRRGETERQKYFLPGRQKYLSALVSPLWAETSQLFTYTALFNAFNSRFGTFFQWRSQGGPGGPWPPPNFC